MEESTNVKDRYPLDRFCFTAMGIYDRYPQPCVANTEATDGRPRRCRRSSRLNWVTPSENPRRKGVTLRYACGYIQQFNLIAQNRPLTVYQ